MNRDLIEFLESKRWFGDKGREIRKAVLTDVIPCEWAGSRTPYAVARANVTTDDGTSTYQLFFERGAPRINDALDEPEFRRGLADAFVTNAAFEHGGVRWIAESEGKVPLTVPPTADITVSSAQQSNSSMIIDGEAILKIFRRLESGVHPDVEVTRFLTIERGFVHVPVLLGTLRFEDARGTMIAGMLQELVPGAVDGWTYALSCSREYFAAPASQHPPLPFGAAATRLGEVTRAMHETLASGDSGSAFEAQHATPTDVHQWAAQASETIDRATRALERAIAAGKIPSEHVAAAEQVVAHEAQYAAVPATLAHEIGDDVGTKARTHGDFHLGQVIRSAAGAFLVIDFEGEPARPLRDRRGHHSPLRDVAGMLRSFAYGAAAGATGPDGPRRRIQWEEHAREAFLRGYHSAGAGALLPRAHNHAAHLITLFEIEKIFYELQYELDHRPDWVWIPLGGIAGLRA